MAQIIILTLAGLAGLAVLFFFADLLLLVFAAILIAAALDALIRLVRIVLPFNRLAALGLTLVLALAVLAFLVFVGSVTLVDQLEALSKALAEAWVTVAGVLNEWGIPAPRNFDYDDVVGSLPEPQTVFGGAGAVLGRGLGMLSNLVIAFLMGVFLAIDPQRYRDGLVVLAPRHFRDRAREVLDRTGATLQHWLVGQLALMAIVGGATTTLLLVMGVSYAVLLGLIAGLLNFIPFVGPILAFIPIGLAMLGQDMTTALVVLGGYTLIQQADANLFTPLIQDRVVNLAPALSIAFLLFMGIATGPIGVALATPLLAALRVLVLNLYVGDFLGDRANDRE